MGCLFGHIGNGPLSASRRSLAHGGVQHQSAVSAPEFHPLKKEPGIVDVNVLYHSLLT